MVDLPTPDASDELIEYLEHAANSAEDWHDISASLHNREQETGDVQAGWLMTAFDYHLARRVRGEHTKPAFGDTMTLVGGQSYPTPLPSVPEEVVTLWATTADRAGAPAVRARLHHLLFERRHGNKRDRAREASAAYLALGTSGWSRLERVNCLHWAVVLSKQVGDEEEAAKAYPVLAALAAESLDQEDPEPGVALHALEVLAFEDSGNAELPALLERARSTYGKDPWNVGHTISLQEQIFRGDEGKREQLRRESVEAYLEHADRFAPGLVRMSFLEDAARLANQFGFPDLAKRATAAMQHMSIEDLDLKTFSASVTIPKEVVDARVASLVDKDTLAQGLEALAACDPPTGDLQTNLKTTQQIAEQAPLSSHFPTTHIRKEGLASYTASSDADQLDEQLSRVEAIGLGYGGEVTARVLDALLERFAPSQEEIVAALQGLPHVSAHVARSVARGLVAFQAGRFEEAATVTMPRVETLVRALCEEKGVLEYRVQRDQRQGPSTRGQFPQLGALLAQIKPWMDPSWRRYFWTFLVSPFGPNYRNELLHGYIDDVPRVAAALTLLASLRLALIPLNIDPAREEPEPSDAGA